MLRRRKKTKKGEGRGETKRIAKRLEKRWAGGARRGCLGNKAGETAQDRDMTNEKGTKATKRLSKHGEA
eukprot:8299492-Pyramimonas_sp.AAC.1